MMHICLAEAVAKEYGIGRDLQDEFALRSHRLASTAQRSGLFREEIVSVDLSARQPRRGATGGFCEDEGVRHDSTLDGLRKLKPAFASTNGTVTAGISSCIRLFLH